MSQDYLECKSVRYVKRDRPWPRFRLVGGELQRLTSEDSVPEYLYQDAQTTEWRELKGR